MPPMTQKAIEAEWAEREKKLEAARQQRRRLEWTLAGSTRDIQKFTAAPIALTPLIESLTLALAVATELRQVNADSKQVEDAL
jgi:hypothetical protein